MKMPFLPTFYPLIPVGNRFSDDPRRFGAPEGFVINVRDLHILAGAGFIVAMTGEIMTMPSLPKVPAAENIDIDDHGKISGLF